MANTVSDILNLALKRINVVQPGATIDGSNVVDAFNLCNLWLDSLAQERLMIPFVLGTSFTITSTKGFPGAPYTVGPSGDVNVTTAPAFIDHVSYTNNATSPVTEILLTPLTSDAYEAIPTKNQTSSLPGSWYYQPTFAGNLGSLYLWAVATQASLTGTMYAPSAVQQFTSPTQTVVVPPGYQRFFVDGLGVYLWSTFKEGIPPDPVLVESAREAKHAIQTKNVPMLDMSVDPALIRSSGYRSNIYAGWP